MPPRRFAARCCQLLLLCCQAHAICWLIADYFSLPLSPLLSDIFAITLPLPDIFRFCPMSHS
jgi:hypothetical protein